MNEKRFSGFFLSSNGEHDMMLSDLRGRDLLRTIIDLEVGLVAVDNLLELGENATDLTSFLEAIPFAVKLVQITGSPSSGYKKMTQLIRESGYPLPDRKLTALETAKYCALLAANNIGYELKLFENETKVIISRARSKGPGGQSQQRFSRRLDQNVLTIAKSVEQKLRSAKYDYERLKSNKSIVFLIYQPISKVRTLVKEGRDDDGQIQIRKVPVHKHSYLPLDRSKHSINSKKHYLIVGIDPGLTVGITAFSLVGKVVTSVSKRQMSRGNVVQLINDLGIPVLICSDVYPIPRFVQKIAAIFKTRTFSPRKLLTVQDKYELSRIYGSELGKLNAHQRDSLAAAALSYSHFKKRITSVLQDKTLEYNDRERRFLAALLIKGLSFNEAKDRVDLQRERLAWPTQKVSSTVLLEEKVPYETLVSQIDSLHTHIQKLEEYIQNLENAFDVSLNHRSDLQKRIRHYKEKSKRVRRSIELDINREKAQQLRDSYIDSLEGKLDLKDVESETLSQRILELKEFIWLRDQKHYSPLKVLSEFTTESVQHLIEENSTKQGDFLLILDATKGGRKTALELVMNGFETIIIESGTFSSRALETFVESGIGICDSNGLMIKRIGDFAIIEDKSLRSAKNRGFQWLSNQRQSLLNDSVESIVENYRYDRHQESSADIE